MKPIACANDLVAVMANVAGLQEVSGIVSGFCAICNLTILPTKLSTIYHTFGPCQAVQTHELVTYHGRRWTPEQTKMRGIGEGECPLKYLGVLTDSDNSYTDLYQALTEKIA